MTPLANDTNLYQRTICNIVTKYSTMYWRNYLHTQTIEFTSGWQNALERSRIQIEPSQQKTDYAR